jgi:diaminopimelate epimerase
MKGPLVPFAKASACGNDFLIIDGMHAPADLAAFSRLICDRHNGVGADGVEWLFPAQDADIRARLINADGSDAEISGNGTRCVAAYMCWQSPREQVTVRTGAGIKNCVLASHTENTFEFETAMGEPQVGVEFPIKVAFGEVRGTPVSMGNPHYVVFVDDFAPGWQAEAAEIGKHHDFKYGINVDFEKVNDAENI